MHDPSLSQSLDFFGCFWGTFSPSRRHIRSTIARQAICCANLPKGALHVHGPSGLVQKGRDAPIAIATILRGQRDDVRGQRFLIGTLARHLPLGRTVLAEHAAGKPFRDTEVLHDVIDTTTAAGGAQKFR